jgi:hypothetical protein
VEYEEEEEEEEEEVAVENGDEQGELRSLSTGRLIYACPSRPTMAFAPKKLLSCSGSFSAADGSRSYACSFWPYLLFLGRGCGLEGDDGGGPRGEGEGMARGDGEGNARGWRIREMKNRLYWLEHLPIFVIYYRSLPRK